jgi:hypothetical protein
MVFRIEIEVRSCRRFFMLKLLVVALLVAVCAGCAGTSGGSSSAGGSSGITMYGVIDEGISVRK